jgi:hypothetical protein
VNQFYYNAQIIHTMPLQLLRLCGNPIVSIAKHYRKLTIFAMPTVGELIRFTVKFPKYW